MKMSENLKKLLDIFIIIFSVETAFAQTERRFGWKETDFLLNGKSFVMPSGKLY